MDAIKRALRLGREDADGMTAADRQREAEEAERRGPGRPLTREQIAMIHDRHRNDSRLAS